MDNHPFFGDFAPRLIKVYESDPEGFWDISMNRFLSYFGQPTALARRSLNVMTLAGLFRGVDRDTARLIESFDRNWGTRIARLKSARKQYIDDAIPVFSMLAIWAKERGLGEVLAKYDRVLTAGIYAVLGYSILDDNLDSRSPNPEEILTSQLLLAEYESISYEVFGAGPRQRAAFHRIRLMFLRSEIAEKRARWIGSPYVKGRPIDLGTKGLNAVAPFILCLEAAGRASQTDAYIEVFLLIGAVIQMIDDWKDLEADLSIGHYAYVTLGHDSRGRSAAAVAAELRADYRAARTTLDECREMLSTAARILAELEDPIMARLRDITARRLESFYAKSFPGLAASAGG